MCLAGHLYCLLQFLDSVLQHDHTVTARLFIVVSDHCCGGECTTIKNVFSFGIFVQTPHLRMAKTQRHFKLCVGTVIMRHTFIQSTPHTYRP